MRALIFALVSMVAVLPAVVHAQQPNPNVLPSCSRDQASELSALLSDLNTYLAMTLEADTLTAIEDLQDRFWTEYLPGSPQCALSLRLMTLYGHMIDELLIVTLYERVDLPLYAAQHTGAVAAYSQTILIALRDVDRLAGVPLSATSTPPARNG